MADRLLNHIPLAKLAGIGPSLESKFSQLGIKSVQDLLLHFPLRYEDRSTSSAIGEVAIGETTTIQGCIIKSEIIITKRKMLLYRNFTFSSFQYGDEGFPSPW